MSATTFDELSVRTGIAIPDLLRQLIANGRTSYGPDWSSIWRDRMLNDPPALISVYDFEWIDAQQASAEVEEWLSPQWQHGRRFLPFGQSGAGDAYCLTPLADGALGVACVWHDAQSRIEYRSFSDFVGAKFLETFADASHLADDMSDEEVGRCIAADVLAVSRYMDAATASYLQGLSRQGVIRREYRAAPRARPELVPSLMSQAQLDESMGRFELSPPEPIRITARWDIGS